MPSLAAYRFAGGTAVVTGAASGMGEQMAHQLARRGSRLVLVDRDDARLAAVAGSVRAGTGASVHAEVFDLADVAGIPLLAQRILTVAPDVSLLVNNAGVALGGAFRQVSAEEFDWVLDVNLRAPVALTRAFLPALTARPGSHVVFLSSLFGLIGPPGQSAYCASKYALRGFAEVLRHELAEDHVGVTTVHPGGIRTRIAETARIGSGVSPQEVSEHEGAWRRLLTYPADRAAGQILDAVEQRRPRLVITWQARVADVAARLAPLRYDVLLRLGR